MAYLTEQRLRDRAAREYRRVLKSAQVRLAEVVQSSRTHFDVFLSHSIKDAELVDGARLELEDKGLTVYVDWVVDPAMSRESVTAATANLLRLRMRQSDSLLYMHTENSPQSKWMPWELGFFDGAKGRVAILPVLKSPTSAFRGQEYLGIYPAVDFAPSTSGQERMWTQRSRDEYASFKEWLVDPSSIRRRTL